MVKAPPTLEEMYNAILRNSLASFIEKTYYTVAASQAYVRNWHILLIADALERCERGEIKRLIINLPPRSLKSVCASVAFPAWLLGRDPRRRIICVSYSDELAGKHARDCRSMIESSRYKRVFPFTRLNPHKRSEGEFETTCGGCRISTSVGGTLTGRGGSFIIIDDPLKPQDALSDTRRNNVNQWYNNTLFSRLDNKETGCIIIVMQRIHLDDLVGFVQQNEEWTVLNLPAIAINDEVHCLSNGEKLKRAAGVVLNPTLESAATLAGIKANMGSYNFSAQYQQEPVPDSGNIIKWEWFRTYDELPVRQSGRDRIIMSCDTAMKAHDGSDYSAFIIAREIDRRLYILDVFRDKLDFPQLRRKILELMGEFNVHTLLIEDKGSGTALIQQLYRDGIGAIAYEPKGDKKDRAVTQSAYIEGGQVHIPEYASWLDDFRQEIVAFPYGRNDDQVDALSQLIDWLWGDGVSIFDVLD
ncbi:MAG TPA: phage terminase large subunit [Rickettsiales bacterium]|nr:phage terminase large subunit [Rickettsiales bacterium]